MKTAVLLIGNIRDWESCKPSFKQALGDHDIFVSTYDVRYNYHPINKPTMGDLENEILSPDYIINTFNDLKLKSIDIEHHEYVESKISKDASSFHGSFNGLEISFGQYRKLKRAIDLMTAYEDLHKFKYESVIRVRFDIVYHPFPIDTTVSNKHFVYNESADEYVRNSPLLPDHIFMCSRDNMIEVSDFMYNEFFNPIYTNSNESPPHGLLRNSILYYSLIKQPRKLAKNILRKNGELLVL